MSKIVIDQVHAANVLQRMWEQCESKQFCDVMLIGGTEETRIPAHRSVLCASSDYFKTMFTASFNESNAGEVELPEVDGEVLKSLVKYCYTGHVEISEDNVEKLLETSDLLLFDVVVKDCGNFLAEQLHPTNCLGFALLAERHRCESLLKKAKDYCFEHFMDVYKTNEFLGLNANQLGQLLESDDLRVPTEEYVFKSLMTWLEHDRLNRQQYKDELFKLVRMSLINMSFLTENVKPVCTSTTCLQLCMEAMEWHSEPKRRIQNTSKPTKQRKYYQVMISIVSDGDKSNIQFYCPQKRQWTRYWVNFDSCTNYGLAVMKNDIFIVGGETGGPNFLDTVICLNLKTMTLKNVSPMNEYRSGVRAAVLKGFLYAVGGNNHFNSLSSVEKWDSETDTWHEVASMSVSRENCGIAVLNEKLFVIGGVTDGGIKLSSAEYYDPQNNVWTSIASMNGECDDPKVAVSEGMLYAIGNLRSNTVERYDSKSDKWTAVCSLSGANPKSFTTIYDKVMVVYNDRVEEYNPTTNEWVTNASLKGLQFVDNIFTYSGETLMSNFFKD